LETWRYTQVFPLSAEVAGTSLADVGDCIAIAVAGGSAPAHALDGPRQ
jgi:hypothetical protein